MIRRLSVVALLAAASAQLGGSAEVNAWSKVDEGKTGGRVGSVLLAAPDLKQLLLVGPTKAAFVQAFDPAARAWTDLAAATPPGKDPIHPYYQAAYDPGTRTIYCLSGGPVLYAFSLAEKTWKGFPAAPALDGLAWHTLACDPIGKRLVVVGADKKADNLGWCRTVVYDIEADKWTRVDVVDEKAVQEHRELVAAKEAAIDLVGHIRLAWFRDPKGVGTEAELKALGERCAALEKMPQMDKFAADAGAVADLLTASKTFDALKAARALQRKIEDAAEAQWPVPCSRRNSPLVFDATNRVFVLFGGDHEDYLMNDTWVLDLAKKAWRRAAPDKAPSPRAGHALCALPKSGRIALYEGYIQSSSTDYGAGPSQVLGPQQLWLYDPKADRWDLAGSWPLSGKDDRSTPAPVGFFDGYASQWFSPPALAADGEDRLVLAASDSAPWFRRVKRPSETWMLAVDPAQTDTAGREKLGADPNQRLYRAGPFTASFCEVPDPPKDTALGQLPANRWVRLPASPRNPCQGCRQRDWSTNTWDSDRDQILLWGGGHCVRSASVVAHYSPASGRLVESYDADEPYGANGGGGFDSSLLGRPWVSTHNYHHYAYDPKCKLLVSGRGYLYDPERMDWLRIEPYALPFAFSWGSTCVATSPHGAIAWAHKKRGDDCGLWLFDRQKGWTDLEPKGKLFAPYCDSHGMVYDSKRDRMILSGVGGGYSKISNGTFLAFDFKTRELSTLAPENAEFAKTHDARELAYIEHADWILIGELYPAGEQKVPTRYTRVYDCAKNRMFLLEAGTVPDSYSTGWMYDSKRKLAYVFTFRGEAWAIKIDPATAAPLDSAPK